jgi:hypothetical protein
MPSQLVVCGLRIQFSVWFRVWRGTRPSPSRSRGSVATEIERTPLLVALASLPMYHRRCGAFLSSSLFPHYCPSMFFRMVLVHDLLQSINAAIMGLVLNDASSAIQGHTPSSRSSQFLRRSSSTRSARRSTRTGSVDRTVGCWAGVDRGHTPGNRGDFVVPAQVRSRAELLEIHAVRRRLPAYHGHIDGILVRPVVLR